MAKVEETAIREAIRERVMAGIKGVELAAEVAMGLRCDGERFLTVLGAMVEAGEVVEVEYITPENRSPDMARVKSFYLPAGTTVRLATPQAI